MNAQILSIAPDPAAAIAVAGAAYQSDLAGRVLRHAPSVGAHATSIPSVTLFHSACSSGPLPSIYEPCLCIVIQGRKRAVLGNEVYVYDALNYLVVSVTLPARSHIVEAAPGQPYLCLRIGIDANMISDLLLQLGPGAAPNPAGGRALFLGHMTEPMLDAISRLIQLLDRPSEAAILGPWVLREIHYRALTGELGYRLREICTVDSHAQRIARVINLLKAEYAAALTVEELAAVAHMSVSSLHHRFKEITALSPMQYLKQLRLHEARRLMLTGGLDASAASFRVGYESPSQFSREYRRLFGTSPRREIASLLSKPSAPSSVQA
jgi:AraC-like DNA-binding protein